MEGDLEGFELFSKYWIWSLRSKSSALLALLIIIINKARNENNALLLGNSLIKSSPWNAFYI